MNSGASASIGVGGQSGDAASTASSNQTSRPSLIGTSIPTLRTTTTCSSAGSAPRCLSTSGLTGATLPLRRPPSAVISTFAPETSIRSATDPAEKPPKTTLWTAPIRVQASIATATSGIIGR